MAAMEGMMQQPVERLNQAVQQQLNLEAVKTRAVSLFKAISSFLEDFDAYACTNTYPNVLPVMLLSKLLPEMEIDDNSKRKLLLQGIQNLPISTQIEKLKVRIDMIGAACESAEKVLADTHKAYYFGTRQGPAIAPTLDKGEAATIQQQETLLRAAVNFGEGFLLI
ncbi:mediator of RNA polymerase II transcription subunit 8-like [Quillaja saponaria]|uniref:Mediator of RNA polymerase II transcription subunit 8-like n=1 Tax=Quillaja saponaria TaxID=32244 RepID=A0AAD7L723_QUISA|nr:mediator of RNA polymerase II transcription subunit 8-like [Quillaja saponaria]